MEEFTKLSQLLNSLECSKESRQQVQDLLLAIQRDPRNWPFIPQWLDSPLPQVQFFGAQCLLIRINRDWDTLEEDEQFQLRHLIGSLLSRTSHSLTAAAKNKLEEALVRVMEKAFISGWWKDPIGDLLVSGVNNFSLLAQIATTTSTAESSSTAYSWHHEIKAHSNQIIETIIKEDISEGALECLKNWTSFGAFNFTQIERILPLLTACKFEHVEAVVDCLVEICEVVTRDPAEEARKARLIIPFCLHLTDEIDPTVVTKLTASLTEECANFLVQSCHDPQVQSFLGLLLNLTKSDGIVGVDNQTSQMTLNAWYLLTEAIDSELPQSHATILVSLFGESLAPILIQKATLPSPQIWAKLQRDLQQHFLQLRKDFLDTLLYIQRALKTLGAPTLLLDRLHCDLRDNQQHKLVVECRLRALMVIAEEEDCTDFNEETGESLAWTPAWQNLAALIFSCPAITQEAINAKLAISLIGALLPLMKGTLAADEAVKMLLGQLQCNPLVREECLAALQQAADCEVSLLTEPQIISNLLTFLATSDSSRPQLLKLLSRLVSDLRDEEQRWNAFNALIQACSADHSELAQILRAPFTFKTESLLNDPSSPFKAVLNHLKRTCSSSAGEALLAAWLSLSGTNFFPIFESDLTVDPAEFFASYLNSNDPQLFVLGCKLLAAWVYGMERVDPARSLKLLETATSNHVLCISDPPEEALEAILDSWIHLIKKIRTDSPVIYDLYTWILQRISIGQLSVPLLRSLARFLCILIEFKTDTDKLLFPVLEVILSVGISGKIGRSGMEILARVAHDISLQHPDFFRTALTQLINNFDAINSNDKKTFLRNIGAAHTIKKFKTVLVDFCLQSRGII